MELSFTTPVPGLPSLCPAGTPLPKYIIAIMVDATVKAAHFTSAGRSQRDIQPWSDTFLGQVARLVLEKFRTGELTSAAQQLYDCAAAEGGGGTDSCSSNLTCSRASASARGVVDFSGISGVTCAHSFPLLNCFVAMPAPEQWAFHIAAIAEALTRRPDIRHVYIDIACRMRQALLAELQKLVQGTPSRLLPSTVEKVSADAGLHAVGLHAGKRWAEPGVRQQPTKPAASGDQRIQHYICFQADGVVADVAACVACPCPAFPSSR